MKRIVFCAVALALSACASTAPVPSSTMSEADATGADAPMRAAATGADAPKADANGVLLGTLDPEEIRRIVREHAGQIRWCYENEVTSTPGLAGKIIMKWVIDKTGSVTSASVAETQMNSANVENCLASRIRGWKFPEPKGGGIVIVNYPFVFRQVVPVGTPASSPPSPPSPSPSP